MRNDLKTKQAEEPMLKESLDRFVIFPIQDAEIWDMYKKSVASFWTVDELDFESDVDDWNELDDAERHFITTVLCFFAASDGIVNENIILNLYTAIQIPEARSFYSFQIAMEQIHSETYSLLIDRYIPNKKDKDVAFRAIETCEVVKDKAEWAIKWMNGDVSYYERLVAYACVEGILFSGSFCAIFWLKKKGLMPGLTFSNELISRDEGLHTDFACLLYRKLRHKLAESEVHEIVRGAVEVEEKFICHALPCSLIGISSKSMKEYIRFIADRLLVSLGVQKMFHDSNPFEWMDLISLQGKTNFFEKRVAEYQKANVMQSAANNCKAFTLDEEF